MVIQATDQILKQQYRTETRYYGQKLNALHNFLPSKLNRPLRRRGHDFELPIVKTERFKNAFINRCLFNFIPEPTARSAVRGY